MCQGPLGGEDCSSLSFPQHSKLPLLVTPQVWSQPALTLSKVPLGWVDWPKLSRPQHSTLPLLFTPQAWR